MNRNMLAASALALSALALSPVALAGVVYSEGFTAGQFSPWTQGDAYWSDCTRQRNCVDGAGGQSGAFLRLGTSGGVEPDHRFFISSQIAVNAEATYTLTFFLRDNYHLGTRQPYNVPVMAKINGAQVGGLVKAASAGWNRIDLIWESGSATQAQISLWNEYQLSTYWQTASAGSRNWGFGNDFALDTVSLSCSTDCGTAAPAVPEPATLALVGAALAGLALARRRQA